MALMIKPSRTILSLLAVLFFAASPARTQDIYSAIDVTVPSTSAGSAGLAVRIYAPSAARFPEGAPVAIYVPGGGGTDAFVIRDRDHTGGGVVEITFAFPGGELDGRRSGGSADQRGPLALRALADVVEFALGRTRTTDSRLIGEYLPYATLATNVGVVGWSRGGDATINALARNPAQTSGVAWIITHESPAFDSGMLGEIVLRPGATYAPADYVVGSCAMLACDVDYPGLRWNGSTRGGGSLYLDRNGSGRADSTEPSLPAMLLTGTTKRVFTMSATEAAASSGAFGAAWPDTIATVDEAREHWVWRDVRANLADLVTGHPGLAVMLHGTTEDHVQTSPDHAHLGLVYNSLLFGGARWVRLNPDAAYTASVAASLPDNNANAPLPVDISAALIPEASSNDNAIVHAGIYELADRTRYGRWDTNLTSALR
jgi:hypothetical protein